MVFLRVSLSIRILCEIVYQYEKFDRKGKLQKFFDSKKLAGKVGELSVELQNVINQCLLSPLMSIINLIRPVEMQVLTAVDAQQLGHAVAVETNQRVANLQSRLGGLSLTYPSNGSQYHNDVRLSIICRNVLVRLMKTSSEYFTWKTL